MIDSDLQLFIETEQDSTRLIFIQYLHAQILKVKNDIQVMSGFFALLGSLCVKAAQKNVGDIDPWFLSLSVAYTLNSDGVFFNIWFLTDIMTQAYQKN